MKTGNKFIANAFVGEAVGQLDNVIPTAEIIANMVQEAETLLRSKW